MSSMALLFRLAFCVLFLWTRCTAEQPKGFVSTVDGNYKFVGEEITVTCTLTQFGGYDSRDLFFVFIDQFEGRCGRNQTDLLRAESVGEAAIGNFSHSCRRRLWAMLKAWPTDASDTERENDQVIPPENVEVVNSSTIQISLNASSEKDAGQYCCVSGFDEFIDELDVFVEKPPRKVRNITCFVYDWTELLSCTWDLGETYYSMSDVKVTADLSPLRVGTDPCPGNDSSTHLLSNGCTWRSDHFRAASFYVLTVTVHNKRRNVSASEELYFETSQIVKPSPVEDLHVSSQNSRCVIVSWSHAKLRRDKFYRVICGGTCADKTINQTKETSAQLCGFRPATSYNITVQCHPGGDKGFWSDNATITVTTDEAEPESSFPVQPGSYYLHPCVNGKRNITVYWKSVPADKRNGEIVGYRLIINGSEPVDVNVSAPTSAVIPDVPCDMPVEARIFARTRVGPSKTNSRIMLYPGSGPLLDLAVNTTNTDRKLKVIWHSSKTSLPDNVMSDDTDANKNVMSSGEEVERENVTVFWCQGDIQTKICDGEIQFVVSDVRAGTVEILLLDEPWKYLFGISTAGKAIAWTDCLFREQEPESAPEGLQVHPGNKPGQLSIQWRARKCSYNFPVKVAGYRLNVCEKEDCDSKRYKSYSVTGADSFNTVVSGTAGIEYGVTLQLYTVSEKFSPESERQFGRAAENREGPAFPVWIIIVLSVCAAPVLVFAVGFGVSYYRKQSGKFRLQRHVTPRLRHRGYEDVPNSPSKAPPVLPPARNETAVQMENGDGILFLELGDTSRNATSNRQSLSDPSAQGIRFWARETEGIPHISESSTQVAGTNIGMDGEEGKATPNFASSTNFGGNRVGMGGTDGNTINNIESYTQVGGSGIEMGNSNFAQGIENPSFSWSSQESNAVLAFRYGETTKKKSSELPARETREENGKVNGNKEWKEIKAVVRNQSGYLPQSAVFSSGLKQITCLTEDELLGNTHTDPLQPKQENIPSSSNDRAMVREDLMPLQPKQENIPSSSNDRAMVREDLMPLQPKQSAISCNNDSNTGRQQITLLKPKQEGTASDDSCNTIRDNFVETDVSSRPYFCSPDGPSVVSGNSTDQNTSQMPDYVRCENNGYVAHNAPNQAGEHPSVGRSLAGSVYEASTAGDDVSSNITDLSSLAASENSAEQNTAGTSDYVRYENADSISRPSVGDTSEPSLVCQPAQGEAGVISLTVGKTNPVSSAFDHSSILPETERLAEQNITHPRNGCLSEHDTSATSDYVNYEHSAAYVSHPSAEQTDALPRGTGVLRDSGDNQATSMENETRERQAVASVPEPVEQELQGEDDFQGASSASPSDYVQIGHK